MKKIIMVILILGLLIIVGCQQNNIFNNNGYQQLTFEELENANCDTIIKWYNGCDNEDIITWKQDCRGKLLPHILRCKSPQTITTS